ncbi:bacillithiol biosynthesis deacetylase BshB1 [Bacillaceae bacterium SIJ1]|uniref:bacillithiol biosynthesis deacetylase BshB1 n=1 Tax=Litoribacterium kuwaitense TaxID=1398745 RepID=UPI0013EA6E62|nr:bacillithiol biosynthesis deacetylase BshB1 [Litoribacterium kuwaitense]NGP43732.1 bacillithiol biosynthesis deacetylase BshB1 [Litoribacterium kuwaitense]
MVKKNMPSIDVLAIGAHPDDVEIGMGGALARFHQEDLKTMICDLTEGEMSSNGTVETRREEALKAADILGAYRQNGQFPDRGLYEHRQDIIAYLVGLIRTVQPKVVFAPSANDRHPDHGQCATLVKEAVFSAGIFKSHPTLGKAHKASALYFYMINGFTPPQFLIDVASVYERKRASLLAYTTQFGQQSNVQTPLTDGYLETIEGRDRLMAKEQGLTLAEGFLSDKPLVFAPESIKEFS